MSNCRRRDAAYWQVRLSVVGTTIHVPTQVEALRGLVGSEASGTWTNFGLIGLAPGIMGLAWPGPIRETPITKKMLFLFKYENNKYQIKYNIEIA